MPYGYGEVRDYLATPFETNSCDWVITNPPFRLGEQFVLRSLKVARRVLPYLARTVFIESVGRYENVFRQNATHEVRAVHRAGAYGEGSAR